MVRIRLRRVGSKKQPSYRIVVADSRSPRDGRYIEIVGFYNPRTEPATRQVKEDRIYYWLGVGAQPSETVEYILKELGTRDRFTRLQKGEELEALVAEAEAAEAAREPISPKTKYPAKPKAVAPAVVEETAEVEAVEETPEVEEAVAEEPVAEAVEEAPVAEETATEETEEAAE
ncbi:30S ribosomal protein S16 [Chloroflexota bacterium]